MGHGWLTPAQSCSGKLNLHEFAAGATNTNPHWGICRNPYNLDRMPGGSSGGSGAAIVAKSAAATIGTDTGGSIRIPAAFCGCVGMKRTWSRVSRYGVFPLADSLDHAGPITRTVRDAALMLQVIAGHDPNDATSSRSLFPTMLSACGRTSKDVRIGIIAGSYDRPDRRGRALLQRRRARSCEFARCRSRRSLATAHIDHVTPRSPPISPGPKPPSITSAMDADAPAGLRPTSDGSSKVR